MRSKAATNIEYLKVMLGNMAVAVRENDSFLTKDDGATIFDSVLLIWLSLCGAIVDSLEESAVEELHETSLVYSRLYDVMSSVDWHRISVFSSAYEPALRDLRYSLEDMAAAFYLDRNYVGQSNSEKIMHLQNLPRMRKVLDRCCLPANAQDRVYTIYKKLCGFSHPSSAILRNPKQPWNPRYGSDPERLRQTVELFRECYDSITYLVIYRFPGLIQYVRSGLQMLDLGMLDKTGFILTLSLFGAKID